MAENQKMKALYDAASKKYNLGSYEHFEKTMQDEGKRKTFYDAASKKFNLGSYEDYSTKLGFMSGGHEDVAGRTLGVSRKEDNPQYVPEQKEEKPIVASVAEVQTQQPAQTQQPVQIQQPAKTTAEVVEPTTSSQPEHKEEKTDYGVPSATVPEIKTPQLDPFGTVSRQNERMSQINDALLQEADLRLRARRKIEKATSDMKIEKRFDDALDRNVDEFRKVERDLASKGFIVPGTIARTGEFYSQRPAEVIDGIINGSMDSITDMAISALSGDKDIAQNEEDAGQRRELTTEEQKLLDRKIAMAVGEIENGLRQKMYDRFKERNAPKSWLDYIASSAVFNNTAMSLANSIAQRISKNPKLEDMLLQEAIAEYGNDANWLVKGAASAAPIIVDAPIFSIAGAGSRMLGGVATKLSSRLIGRYALGRKASSSVMKGLLGKATTVGERAASMNPVTRAAAGIIGKSLAGGYTFGNYESIVKGVEMLGDTNTDYSIGDVLGGIGGAWDKGFGTGATLGAIGGTMGALTEKSSKAIKAAGDVAGFGLEGGYFSLSEARSMVEQDGVEWSDVPWSEIVGKNLAMIGVMKAQHVGDIVDRYKSRTARDFGMEFDEGNIAELRRAGYMNGSLGGFIRELMKGTKPKSDNIGDIIDNKLYEQIKADENISLDTKSKLGYIFGGKLAPYSYGVDGNGNRIGVYDPVMSAYSSMVVNYGDSRQDGGRFAVVFHNEKGQLVKEVVFDSLEEARKFYAETEPEVLGNVVRTMRHLAEEVDGDGYRMLDDDSIDLIMQKPYDKRTDEDRTKITDYINSLNDIVYRATTDPRVVAVEDIADADAGTVVRGTIDGKPVTVKGADGEGDTVIVTYSDGSSMMVSKDKVGIAERQSVEEAVLDAVETYDPEKGAQVGNVIPIPTVDGKWMEMRVEKITEDGKIFLEGEKEPLTQTDIDTFISDKAEHDRQAEQKETVENAKNEAVKSDNDATSWLNIDGEWLPVFGIEDIGGGKVIPLDKDGEPVAEAIDARSLVSKEDFSATEEGKARLGIASSEVKPDAENVQETAQETARTVTEPETTAPENEATVKQDAQTDHSDGMVRDEKGKVDLANSPVDSAVQYLMGKKSDMVSLLDRNIKEVESRIKKLKKKTSLDPDEDEAFQTEYDAEVGRLNEQKVKYQQIKDALIAEKERVAKEEKMLKIQEAEQKAAEQASKKGQQQVAEHDGMDVQESEENAVVVPDFAVDKEEDARARGFRMVNGVRIDRQEPIAEKVSGNEVDTYFSTNEKAKSRIAVVEADALQPSHTAQGRNPKHFIGKAQPKNRATTESQTSSDLIAQNNDPRLITSTGTAYSGAPVVNSRGEAIQGNNRIIGLQKMWSGYPENAARYKQYLLDHAEELGLDKAAVEKMEKPVMVLESDVSDAEAIRLGQFDSHDMESGAGEIFKAKQTLSKMRDGKMQSFLNLILDDHGNPEMPIGDMIRRNAGTIIKWLADNKLITQQQAANCFKNKSIKPEVVDELKSILNMQLLEGGNDNIDVMFDTLPAAAQGAVMSIAGRDSQASKDKRLKPFLQAAIEAYNTAMQNEDFAKNRMDLQSAYDFLVSLTRQTQIFGDGISLDPEKYNNFALKLAAMFKAMTKNNLRSVLNDYYDKINGIAVTDIFDENQGGEAKPMSFEEAVLSTFGVDVSNIKTKQNDRKLSGGDIPQSPGGESREGRPGIGSIDRSGEQDQAGEGRADGTGGTSATVREGRGNGGTAQEAAVTPETESKPIALSDPLAELEGRETYVETTNRRGNEAADAGQKAGNEAVSKLINKNENRLSVKTDKPADESGAVIVGNGDTLHKAKEHYGEDEVTQMEEMARRLGLKIEFKENDTVGGGKANALIRDKDDVVEVEVGNDNALKWLAGHEFLHRARNRGGEKAYRDVIAKMRDAVGEGYIMDRLNELRKVYEERGIDISEDALIEEVIADYCGDLMLNARAAEKFARRKGSGLASWLRNAIADIRENLAGSTTDFASTSYVNALEKAEQSLQDAMERNETGDAETKMSVRTKPEPEKKGIGYKVFYLGNDGKLYPPMVANPNGEHTPIGVWLDADAAPIVERSKTGRDKVKLGGKGTQGGSGTLAYRPGWHLGEIPYALQFNRGEKVDNPLGMKNAKGEIIKVGKYFPKNFVWAEVEYANDVDYQKEAMSYGYNENGKFNHALAGLPKLPVDGSYRYRTNANPATDAWIITGAMKVNRILDKSEVDDIVRKAGREPQEIEPDVRKTGKRQTDAERKKAQFEIIDNTNPALDDYHTWIRKPEDIRTLKEAVDDVLREDQGYSLSSYPDVSDDMIRNAIETGKMTVYSSKPIKNGNFVSPSRMMAYDYAGGGKIYSKTVSIDDVAWITTDEGQYAKTKYSIKRGKDESYADYAKRVVDDYDYQKQGDEWLGRRKDESYADYASRMIRHDRNVKEREQYSIKAYHGSGAEFDKFDHKFMGTGEGAQAYGWGTYVSEVNGVARSYADTAAGSHIYAKADDIFHRIGEVPVWAKNNHERLREWFADEIRTIKLGNKRTEELDNAIRLAEEEAGRMSDDELSQRLLDVSGRSYNPLKDKRHVYDVEIPDDNGSNYIPWNEDVPETILANIREQAAKEGLSDVVEIFDDAIENKAKVKGSYLYHELRGYLGDGKNKATQKEASMFLNRAGLVGIKMPVGYMSSGNDQNSKNYVIFNENNIQIKSHEKFSIKNTTEAKARVDDMQKMIADIMSRQIVNDAGSIKDAVTSLSRFVRNNIDANIGAEIGSTRIKSLLSNIETAVTKQQLEQPVRDIQVMLNDAQTEIAERSYKNLMTKPLHGKNQRGVLVAKGVDEATRKTIDGIRGSESETRTDFDTENMRVGQDYADRIANGDDIPEELERKVNIEMPMRELRVQMGEARAELDAARNDWQQAVAAIYQIRRAPGYMKKRNQQRAIAQAAQDIYIQRQHEYNLQTEDFNRAMSALMTDGSNDLAAWRKRKSDSKKQLLHDAMGDVKYAHVPLEGETPLEGNQTVRDKAARVWTKMKQFSEMPMQSFNFMLQMIDQNHANKQGNLYKYFFKDPKTSIVRAGDDLAEGRYAFGQELESATARFFTVLKKNALDSATSKSLYAKLADESRMPLGTDIVRRCTEAEAASKNKHAVDGRTDWQAGDDYTINGNNVSKGHALYVWLTWRQADGRMKLAAQGYDQQAIDQIGNALGKEWTGFGEWVTDEFLPRLRREKYNPRHIELYGTSMAENEHYFPLKLDRDKIAATGDMNSSEKQYMPSTITPNLIHRTSNRTAIDERANAIEILSQYGNLMEQWCAMSPVIEAMNTLHASPAFKKVMEANEEGSFEMLMKSAQVATQSLYERPNNGVVNTLEKIAQHTISAGARAAIGFRFMTAAKQTLSYPAFMAYSADAKYQAELVRNIVTPVQNHEWAMANLPAYRQRVRESDMGIEGMGDKDYLGSLDRAFSRWGMKANRTIDQLTIAAGARAVYNQAVRDLLKGGFTQEEAHKRAVLEAEIIYNESQQSSRSEFSSEAQKSSTAILRPLILFQNANIGYARQIRTALWDIHKAWRMYNGRESLKDKHAWRIFLKSSASIAMFGAILPLLWSLGGKTSDAGDIANISDEQKDNYAWSVILGLLSNGTTLGSAVNAITNGFDVPEANIYRMLGDIQEAYRTYGRSGEFNKVAASKMLEGGFGISMSTWKNFYDGASDIAGMVIDSANGETSETISADLAMDMMLLMNMNKTDRKGWAQVLYRKHGAAMFAKAYEKASEWERSDRRNAELARKYIESYDSSFEAEMERIGKLYLELQRENTTDERRLEIIESEPMIKNGFFQNGYLPLMEAVKGDIRRGGIAETQQVDDKLIGYIIEMYESMKE